MRSLDLGALCSTISCSPISALFGLNRHRALADRIGHRRLLVIGYALGVSTAALMAIAFAVARRGPLLPLLVGVFTLAGLYVVAEEALEATLTEAYIPAVTRGLAYGALGAVNVGDLMSSAAVGLLWTGVSPVAGFGVAAVTMMVGTLMLARLPDRMAESITTDDTPWRID